MPCPVADATTMSPFNKVMVVVFELGVTTAKRAWHCPDKTISKGKGPKNNATKRENRMYKVFTLLRDMG